MKKEIKTFARWTTAATCVLAMASCTKDFEKINTNPNGVTNEDMEADFNYIGMKFNQPERSIYFCYADGGDGVAGFQVTHNLNADIYSGYMMSAGFDQSNGNYALKGWNNAPWANYYPNLMAPTQRIIDLAVKDNFPDFTAFAKIIRVIGMQQITDKYGPISFSTYGQGGGKIGEYESEEVVYRTFLKELETSIATLTDFVDNKPELTGRFKAFDVLMKGDYKEWIKFANAIRLRVAIRISNVPSMKEEAKKAAEASVNHKYGILDKDVTLSLQGQKNPLYDCSVVYGDINMGATMESILKGYNDPRLPVFWAPSAFDKTYRGIPAGANQSNKNRYMVFSQANLEQQSLVSPNPIFFAAEVSFLRAEGALRGWDMGGDAQGFYTEGVTRSFNQHKAGSPVEYLNDDTSMAAGYTDPTTGIGGSLSVTAGDKRLNNVTIKWDEAASNEVKLQKIITQKWIAIFPLGQEAWSEYRRTGYPVLMPIWENNSTNPGDSDLYGWKDCAADGTAPAGKVQIRRLCFTEDEYRNNAAAVAKACILLSTNGAPGNPKAERSGDMPSARLWWDQGQNNF